MSRIEMIRRCSSSRSSESALNRNCAFAGGNNTLVAPDFPGDETYQGFGGRVTYNFNRSIAAEAEVNFFPQKVFVVRADGNAIQAQFGVKVGKRFDKFGLPDPSGHVSSAVWSKGWEAV